MVIEFIERHEKSTDLLYFLREFILSSDPRVEEKIKYRCPFYHLGKSWIYMTVSKDNSVNLCFINGHKFEHIYPELIANKRKQIRSLNFKSIQDVNTSFINNIIFTSINYQSK